MNNGIQMITKLALVWGPLWLALAGVAHGTAPVVSQSTSPQVTAQLTTGVVKLGSDVSCIVVADGARSASLEDVPEVDNLKLLRISGPSVNTSRRSFFGSLSATRRTHSWSVTFRPEKEGELVIPPMRLTLDGKTVFTRELALSVVKDLTGQELGYLEFDGLPEYVYEGQPFTVRMNFGWDTQFDSQVNVANLILPWWNELPGTLEVESAAAGVGASRAEVTVNSRLRARALEMGERTVRGKPFRVLQLTRSFVATRSGTLEFPMSWLEFGHVRRRAFSEERKTYHVGAPAFSLAVRVLPENGRPPEFSGGVGRFEVQADVNRRDIDLGESIKLTVDWTGDANLEFFELPSPSRLEAFRDFRVYGMTNERFYGDRRRVVYDLAPKSTDVGEIPPLPLVVFDTDLQAYRSVSSRPIPIRVRAVEGATELGALGTEEEPPLVARDIQDPRDVADDISGVGDGVVLGSWIGLPVAWLLARSLVRRRGDPAAPSARRKRRARAQLARGLRSASTASEQARAFHEFLGARSAEEFTAWEGRDLGTWLVEHDKDLPEKTVREVEQVAQALDCKRWAGDNSTVATEPMLKLADELLKEGL